MRRKRTERQILQILIAQGSIIPCGICRVALKLDDQVERDHYIPLALGGEDEPENEQYVHKGCHDTKTNGRNHTSYGSDKHAIAKSRRLRKGRNPAKKKIPSRPFPKKRSA